MGIRAGKSALFSFARAARGSGSAKLPLYHILAILSSKFLKIFCKNFFPEIVNFL